MSKMLQTLRHNRRQICFSSRRVDICFTNGKCPECFAWNVLGHENGRGIKVSHVNATNCFWDSKNSQKSQHIDRLNLKIKLQHDASSNTILSLSMNWFCLQVDNRILTNFVHSWLTRKLSKISCFRHDRNSCTYSAFECPTSGPKGEDHPPQPLPERPGWSWAQNPWSALRWFKDGDWPTQILANRNTQQEIKDHRGRGYTWPVIVPEGPNFKILSTFQGGGEGRQRWYLTPDPIATHTYRTSYPLHWARGSAEWRGLKSYTRFLSSKFMNK